MRGEQGAELQYVANSSARAQRRSLAPHSPQPTMICDNAPSRIFNISELARLIASQLIHIGRKNVVNLACVCRSLEEPVLSTLWEEQSALYTLLEVLPETTWDTRPHGRVVGDPNQGGVRSLNFRSFSSSTLRGIHHLKIGIESSVMPLGCSKFDWRRRSPLQKKPSKNFALIHLSVDGFQWSKS